MERKELAHKILSELKCATIPCTISCYSEGYAESFELYLGEESARYLIKDDITDVSILDGLELCECTLQELLDEVIENSIDDGGEYEYECESECAENYINSLALLINRILDGSITEHNLNEYLEYFSDGDFNFEIDDPLDEN